MRVLLIGATGVFGALLAEGLVRLDGVTPILAARRFRPLAALAATLGGAETVTLDRVGLVAADLRACRADLVIDAAGPFQESGFQVVQAAIEAGVPYLDLADGRAYVAALSRFDGAARRAGVAVLGGASSTPALSHAALDALAGDFARIDRIEVAISPGNRCPRGLSVVRAILGQAGRPVRVWQGGAWRVRRGWGLLTRRRMPGLGPRWLSLCETPDLDLLVARFRPRESAVFRAGLEVAPLHLGLWAASLPVRAGLVRSLAPLAPVAKAAADLLEGAGTDRGGMIVEVQGLDGGGAPFVGRWSLTAPGGVGPYTPTLPALALVRRMAAGWRPRPGAGPCVGLLALDDVAGDFRRLGMQTTLSRRPLPAYPQESALIPRRSG